MRSKGIAASKLTIPQPLQTVVMRPELVARLDGSAHRVALVCAAAGFGKTTVLATWATGRRAPMAWLSCDVTDREPTRFWAGLLAAVSTAWPGAGDDAAIELARSGADTYELAISLGNDLGEVDGPVVIVIDDFHLAQPSPQVVAQFASTMPPNVTLVVGSRVDLPFSLARHRVAGTLLEIRTDDLRFTLGETSALLAANHVATTTAELQQLQDLTEGWPAGIQLAALAMQRSGDRTGFLDSFAATDHGVTDFLVNEVLDRQPPGRVEFMFETSVLEQFDAGLCEAVTGRQDAGVLLHELASASLFVVPIDAGRQWYRYHHLFGAFLRARLKARGRDDLVEVQQRAVRALEDRGDGDGALRLASASGDLETAAIIVRNTIRRSMNVSDVAMSAPAVRYWLYEHGDDQITTDPELVLDFVLAMVVTSGSEDAVQWLNKIGQAHPDAPAELSALLHGIWAEHHLHHGQLEQSYGHAERAMAAVGGDPPRRGLLPMLHVQSARAHLDNGNVAGARTVLDTALDRPSGYPALDDVRLPAARAWVAFLDGDLGRAEQSARSARRRADELDLAPHEPGRVFAGLALAGVLAERTEDREAAMVLAETRHDVDLGGRPAFQRLVALQQAAFAVATGDEAAAETHLMQARRLFSAPSAALQTTFALEAARQALRFQPSAAGAAVAACLDGSAAATALRARFELQRGELGAAADLLDHLPAATTVRERVEYGTLRALVRLPHDVEAAREHFADVIDVGQRECFVRTILQQGPAVRKLLMSVTPDRASQHYLAQLIETNETSSAPVRRMAMSGMVEPLSARELTVLRYLASRLTYQEIARALYVSLNTMKSHVRNVYRKLGVVCRDDAVAAGRQLHLI